LGGRFEEALLRPGEGRCELRHCCKCIVVAGCDRTMGMGEQRRIAEHAALPDHGGEPGAQRLRRSDIAGLDRPFDAARIGERADRIGRRHPGHQPVERGSCEVFSSLRGFA
jgi:hypothetical protein